MKVDRIVSFQIYRTSHGSMPLNNCSISGGRMLEKYTREEDKGQTVWWTISTWLYFVKSIWNSGIMINFPGT